MAQRAIHRAIDDGGPFFVGAHASSPACHHGVVVETPFDAAIDAPDEVVVWLRRAEHHGGSRVDVEIERATVYFSLATGMCTPADSAAEQMLAESDWLAGALRAQLDRVQRRARRHIDQRDRSRCFAALQRAEPGRMVAYDELFPADWDLLVPVDGKTYWAVDHHCPNPGCTCEEITVALYDLDSPQTPCIGDLLIDFTAKRPRSRPSTTAAGKLFEPLWSKHAERLVSRRDDVRRAVRELSQLRAVEPPRPAAPPRNAPCPCGSGKKYKRCCADRDSRAPTRESR